MSNYSISNSNIINVSNTPSIPNIGYYKNDLNNTQNTNQDISQNTNPNNNSYHTLSNNLRQNCTNINTEGIFPQGISEPYNIAINGTWTNIKNNKTNNQPHKYSEAILNQINNLTTNASELCSNQIQYLVCQLINARNRYYDPNDFVINDKLLSLNATFRSFGKSLIIPLSILFVITIYFLVSGTFSSIDIISNIVNIIQLKSDDTKVSYWLGILLGLLIPSILIIIGYKTIINQNIQDLQKENITNNPYGEQDNISQTLINIDYLTIILFVLGIYALIGVLFTIKNTTFSNIFFVGITTVIFIFIFILIFVMYYFIPFFNTTETGKMFQTTPNKLNLYINSQNESKNQDISYIYSNQTQDKTLKQVFVITGICIAVLSIIFFKKYSNLTNSKPTTFISSLIKGFLSSSAVLIIPILWVINYIIGVQFFFIYPIFLILLRFFRYIYMAILYIINKDNTNPMYSDDLTKSLSNFENYSAPWGLFGIEEYKIILGLFGYENLFSKSIIENNNNSYNISDNKFMSSGLLYFFIEKNKNGMFTGSIFLIITLIISAIILFGYIKIQDLY